MTEARYLPEHATTVEGGAAREARESDQRPVKQGENPAPWNAPCISRRSNRGCYRAGHRRAAGRLQRSATAVSLSAYSKTGAIPSTPMTVVVQLIPYDDRGREIIEKLEEEGTQEQRVEIRKYGTREYNLRARNLGMVGFDAMLNRIDPDWREHLGRT